MSTRQRFVIAKLGTAAKPYPQILFYDKHWCLRMGPKFHDWRSFETVEELLFCLMEETIGPQVLHQQLLSTVVQGETALRSILDRLTLFRGLIEASKPKVLHRVPG